MVTPARLSRIQEVASRRTLNFIPVLENIADPHNASAILRSADAFGVHRVEVIASRHVLQATPAISRGTHRWLHLVHHPSPEHCVRDLKARGVRILVACQNASVTPENLSSCPTAAVFGNEHGGVSDATRAMADGTFSVPMVGFVESLNVSVAVAVTMYAATRGAPEAKSESEHREIVARYLMNDVRDADRIIRERVENASSS